METVMSSATARMNTLAFDGAFVTIKKPMAGEKRIPLAAVQAIQFKDASLVTMGWVELTLAGAFERSTRQLGQRTKTAAQNENAVIFGKGASASFRQVRDEIEQAIAARV